MAPIKCAVLAFFVLWAASASAKSDVERRCMSEIVPQAIGDREDGPPFVSYGGDLMCIVDEITKDGARKAVDIIRKHPIKKIMIVSSGGDIDAALDIADEVLKNEIDVYAFNECFSSCANYIFLAGRKKYVLDRAMVAWHGVPTYSEANVANYSAAAKERLKKTAARSDAFFARVGVDLRLPGEVPCDLRQDEAYLEAAEDIGTIHDAYWTYPREILERKFHVQGIEDMPMWENTKEIQQHRLYRKVFVAKGCDN